jgi:hypothetical protein
MPKLTIIVEKDETGKIWDYNLPQENHVNIKNLFGTTSFSIHKSEPVDEIGQKLKKLST